MPGRTSAQGHEATAWLRGLATAGVAVGLGTLTWSVLEARNYTVREFAVPILEPGSRPVRLLQISDLHLIPSQSSKIAWVRDLASLRPDFVVDTGDNFGHVDSLWPLIHALEPLLEFPGAFVLGSNDYYSPTFRNPLRYLVSDSSADSARRTEADLPWDVFARELREAGWLDLDNARALTTIGGHSFELVGMDDPHIGRDRLPASLSDSAEPFGEADPMAKIGIVHAPYRRALDALHADGADLILAGHTHGGQICVPGFGPLTTNCDLNAGRAKGLHRWPGASAEQAGESASSWLHVSEGVGTNPYVRLRLACRPAASLITLTGRIDAPAQ